MRFRNRDYNYHKWFAWYPVLVDYYDKQEQNVRDKQVWVWLEHIERKIIWWDNFFFWHKKYFRFIGDD